jgi:energy-coupling factor transporter ATP-binding protein EcfA2
VVDSIADFIKALDRVPSVLLTADVARVITDARTSAGVLEAIEDSPVAVVIVGATGVGKSHLVNDLVGMSASETGVLRPTTNGVVMAGSCGPAKVDHASEYVLAPDAPDGLAIVDTPAPDTDAVAMSAALAVADMGILVVSPSRYSDAGTHELWSSMEVIPLRLVVLNRLPGNQAERAEIVASAMKRFPDATVLEVDEGGGADDVRGFIIERATDRPSTKEKVTIAMTAAAGAARHVAGEITATAISLGALQDVVNEVPAPEISGEGLAVLESWLATERDLVLLVGRSVNDLDRRIVGTANSDLGQRLGASLGRWESEPLETRLSAWREEAAAEFRASATIRWRRSSAEHLLDQASWKVGVNPTVRVVPRVTRITGSNFERVSVTVHDSLVSTLNSAVDGRRSRWRAAVEKAGSFKPGELLAAADALENR